MQPFLRRNRLWITMGLILLIAVLFVIFVDLEAVLLTLRSADWRWLVAAILALSGGYVTFALRWRFLLAQRPTFMRTFHAVNISQMVNIYSPIPGIPIRILLVSDGTRVTISQATSSSLVERILEQIMRLSALGGALLLGVGAAGARSTIAAGGALVLIAVLLISLALRDPHATQIKLAGLIGRIPFVKPSQVQGVVNGLITGLIDAGTPRAFIIGWLWSLLMWSFFLLYQLSVLLALDLGFSAEVILGICLSALAVAPPSAPAMPGTYHASIVGVLALLTHIDGATLTAYAILLHIIQTVLLTGLGIWGLSSLDLSLREILSAAPEPQSDKAV